VSGDQLYTVAGGNRVLQNMAFTHQKFCSADECSTGNIPDVSAECDIVYTHVFYHIYSPGVSSGTVMYFQDMEKLSLNEKYEMHSTLSSLIDNIIIHIGVLQEFLKKSDVIIVQFLGAIHASHILCITEQCYVNYQWLRHGRQHLEYSRPLQRTV